MNAKEKEVPQETEGGGSPPNWRKENSCGNCKHAHWTSQLWAYVDTCLKYERNTTRYHICDSWEVNK